MRMTTPMCGRRLPLRDSRSCAPRTRRCARRSCSPCTAAATGCGYAKKRPGRRAASPAPQSAERDRVQEPPARPQVVRPALEFQRAVLAYVTVEAVSVVSDLLDDVVDELVVDPEAVAEIAGDAEQALHLRIVRLQHLVDIRLGDALFLGLDHGHQHPLHEVEPLVVAMTDEGPERLLGDAVGQDD